MNDSMKALYLKELLLFKNLQEKEIVRIASMVKIKQLASGEIVNYGNGASSRIYVVLAGKVKLAEMDIENEIVKDVLSEGELFGDLQLEGCPKDFEYGQALTENTIVCYLSVADFSMILQSYPEIAVVYAKKMSMKLKRMETRHFDLMIYSVKLRLLRFIKDWAKMDGNFREGKIMLNNYLTHSDIAGLISTSRQTVTVLFKELKDSGLLSYNRKHIELNNLEKWN